MNIELFLNHTRFDDRPLLFCIDLEDAIEILRHVDYNRIANSLTRQTGSGSAGQDRNLEILATSMVAKTSSCVRGMTTPMGSIS